MIGSVLSPQLEHRALRQRRAFALPSRFTIRNSRANTISPFSLASGQSHNGTQHTLVQQENLRVRFNFGLASTYRVYGWKPVAGSC